MTRITLFADAFKLDPVRVDPGNHGGRHCRIADRPDGLVKHAVADRAAARMIMAGETGFQVVETVEQFQKLGGIPCHRIVAARAGIDRHMTQDHGNFTCCPAHFQLPAQAEAGGSRKHAVPVAQQQFGVKAAVLRRQPGALAAGRGEAAHLQTVQDMEAHAVDREIIEQRFDVEKPGQLLLRMQHEIMVARRIPHRGAASVQHPDDPGDLVGSKPVAEIAGDGDEIELLPVQPFNGSGEQGEGVAIAAAGHRRPVRVLRVADQAE